MKKYIYMKKNKTKIKEKRNEKITKMEKRRKFLFICYCRTQNTVKSVDYYNWLRHIV
jgi:hypothetical protein